MTYHESKSNRNLREVSLFSPRRIETKGREPIIQMARRELAKIGHDTPLTHTETHATILDRAAGLGESISSSLPTAESLHHSSRAVARILGVAFWGTLAALVGVFSALQLGLVSAPLVFNGIAFVNPILAALALFGGPLLLLGGVMALFTIMAILTWLSMRY